MPDTARRRARLPQPHAEIEYLILADQVEALNGKLYMMGGGWDSVFVASVEQPVPVSIACGVLVPWNETDDNHALAIAVQDLDGTAVAPPFSVTFKTGRSPSMENGASTHVPFAVQAQLKFPSHGEYRIVASVDGRDDGARHLAFWVKAMPRVVVPQAS
ncbi:MAG: hypothetical protein ABSE70_01570 [Candidatus Limnocylindrales bacterium]